MLVAFVVSILAVLFSLLDINKPKRKFGGFEFGFLLLTVYLCIRYDYGNDYLSYLNDFEIYRTHNYISVTDFDQLAELQSRGDYGWIIINRVCEPLGFFGMIMLLTVLFMGQLYILIKKYVPPKWYWFSVFLFAFHPMMMVVGVAGMLRQWTVVFIFLCCIDLIRKRKIFLYLAIILAATTIHKTAFLLLPVYFITYFNLNSKHNIISLTLLLILWYILVPLIPDNILMSLFDNDKLAVYGAMVNKKSETGYGISSILVIGMPLLCMAQIRRQDQPVQLLFRLLFLSVLFVPLVYLNTLIGRLVVYFSVFAIVVYPLSIVTLYQKGKGHLCIGIILIFFVYYVYLFADHFTNAVWYDTSFIYHTIFEVPWQ